MATASWANYPASNDETVVRKFEISGQADKKMLTSITGISCSKPVIKLNSVGGDRTVALEIAKEIASKNATIVIDGLCVSSCSEFPLVDRIGRVIESATQTSNTSSSVEVCAEIRDIADDRQVAWAFRDQFYTTLRAS